MQSLSTVLFSVIVWVSPLYMLVEIGLIFEFATALGYRAVFGELGHVVDKCVKQAAELLDLDELFLCGYLLFN